MARVIYNKLAQRAGLLMGFIGLMSFGQVVTAQSSDTREILWLSSEESAIVLSEMRDFVDVSQKILEGTLNGNMEQVEQAARSAGMAAVKGTPKTLMAKLPAGFLKLGPATHKGFEAIANEAATLGDEKVILNTLASLQKNCVSCHNMYQIKVGPTK